MTFAAPARRSSVVCCVSSTVSVSCGSNEFHSGRASMCSIVSNVCGCSPGPGRLCTFVPGAIVTCVGVPSAVSSSNARYAHAAAQGASL